MSAEENTITVNNNEENMTNSEESQDIAQKKAYFMYEPKDALDALDKLACIAFNSRLNAGFRVSSVNCTDYLNDKYGFTSFQSVVISIIINEGKALTLRTIGKFLSLRNAQMLRLEKGILELVKARVLTKTKERDGRGSIVYAYGMRTDVIKALCNNEALKPRTVSGLTEIDFFKELDCIFSDHADDIIDDDEFDERLTEIVQANDNLALCKNIKKYQLTHANERVLLFTLNEYVSRDESCVHIHQFEEIFEGSILGRCIRESFADGYNELLFKGILECESENGLMDISSIHLTLSAKEELLQGLGLRFNKDSKYVGLTDANTITAKSLFYNERETAAVNELTTLLSDENFSNVQARLEEQGMRKGFACLFYGSAGTGKTETVLQIARQTGRDIMQVDLSTIRDKYVGETEKSAKAIFTSYRRAVKKSGKAPILLLNEADAIICRRSTNTEHSVDKMENAMQNIILQEMENLDGILIATTNLTDNMDSAFSRRFLYKIRFDRPSLNTKAAIWKSMLPRLSEEESTELASHYDLSGGQIENIVRKQTVDYVISGEYASLPRIHDYCKAELAGDYTQKNKIGF